MNAPPAQEPTTSALRLLGALAALVIYLGDPSEHPSRRPFGLAVLLLFVAYSAVTYLLELRRTRTLPASVVPWVDVAWVTLLVAASEATSSIFYPLYLFAILYASFGRGLRSGMAVVLASTVSYAAVGVLTAPRGPGFALTPYLVRPLYLLVLGYLTAVWGGREVRSRRRLALLRNVTVLSNPRIGVDRTVGSILEAIRSFYDADSCRIAVVDEQTGRRWMQSASRGVTAPSRPIPLPAEVSEILLPDPPDAAFLVRAGGLLRGGQEPTMEVHDPAGTRSSGEPELAAALADALEASALLSVPLSYRAGARGRLYVVRRALHAFDRGELEFLRHVLDQVVAVLENVRLVDRLASDAAEEERRRIARDLHDSVIQPYLGLRLGLSAVQKALAAGRVDEGHAHLARLVELAESEIETLRGYVRDLRTGDTAVPGGLLDEGVRRFCRRFADATGIQVTVKSEAPSVGSDRLAAEVFQMVAEALSNVRRHTSATVADVSIRTAGDRLHVTVTNDGAGPEGADFVPRSIGERAASLGGTVEVSQREGGTTVVHVDVPL